MNKTVQPDRKHDRIIVNHTKEVLKEYAELLKERFDIDVPKNIVNMRNGDFLDYISKIYSVIKEKGFNPEEYSLGFIDYRLKQCIAILEARYLEIKSL